MADIEAFGLLVLVGGVVVIAAVLANRISALLRVPVAAIFLLGAALASDVRPELYGLSFATVQRVVTVALVVILFDGGMEMGWRRFREAAGGAVLLGVAGTAVTALAVALLAHLLFRLGWLPSALIGIALAPTDPAVVFSVLGSRRVAGRSGSVLKAEAGLNDPVSIALMVSVLAAAPLGTSVRPADVLVTFLLQLVVGALVGAAGGLLLRASVHRLRLPSSALYPLWALAGAAIIYGAAAVVHGSGFLAVFLAGILIGDVQTPYKSELEQTSAVLASLAEIAAFIALGVTVSLFEVVSSGAWVIGLGLAGLLVLVVRPLFVGLLLLPVRLGWNERAFVLWSGLKGAVPILLAVFVVLAGVAGARRVYDIVFVVVAATVIVQGSLVPLVAGRLRVP